MQISPMKNFANQGQKDGGKIQPLDAAINTPEKKIVKNVSSNQPSVGEISKEVGLSIIPVYGTVRAFSQGKIGWGIFGAITDALMLIPVVGSMTKAAGAAIRGGAVVAEAARGAATAAEVARGAATAAEAAQAATTAAEAVREAETVARASTTTVAEAFAAEKSEGLAKSAEGVIYDVPRPSGAKPRPSSALDGAPPPRPSGAKPKVYLGSNSDPRSVLDASPTASGTTCCGRGYAYQMVF